MGRMWWYNILGNNQVSISDILRIDLITAAYVLLTANLLVPKMKNTDPILTVKRTEWGKSIDYFCLSIEANPPRVGKKNVYFVHIGSIPSPSSVQIHIEILHMKKYFNLEPPKLLLYQHTINNSSGTMTHVSSSLRSLGVIYINFFSLVVSNWQIWTLTVLLTCAVGNKPDLN